MPVRQFGNEELKYVKEALTWTDEPAKEKVEA